MPTIKLDVDGLRQADAALRRFGAGLSDWRPYWAQLGERLADEAQARWPLRRQNRTVARIAGWSGNRLGRGGVFESSPDRLAFGSAIFYSRFAQHGTRKQRATPLIHVDEADASTRLTSGQRPALRPADWRSHDAHTAIRLGGQAHHRRRGHVAAIPHDGQDGAALAWDGSV